MNSSNTHISSDQGAEIPKYILDDLASRFIINIPEDERTDLIRIFFQIELAHWFYIDFYCNDSPDLKACGIKEFARQMFNHCPTLAEYARNFDNIMETWREYKMSVPTYGAILMDTTLEHCVLVQGYWSKAGWGFPKGKVNQHESPKECAIREVLEETGFDMTEMINDNDFIEYQMNDHISRLYLVTGISMDTKFQPRTRQEIRNLEWFEIRYLPNHKKDVSCKQHYGLGANSFFMIIPFVKPLKKWIAKRLDKPNFFDDQSDSDRQRTPRPTRPRRASYSDFQQQSISDKSSTGEGRISDKQKLKKHKFAKDMNKQYQDLIGLTVGPSYNQHKLVSPLGGFRGRGNKHGQRSPRHPHSLTPHRKNYDATDSKEGHLGTPSKKSLDNVFKSTDIREKQKRSQPSELNFWSESWEKFSINIEAVLEPFQTLATKKLST